MYSKYHPDSQSSYDIGRRFSNASAFSLGTINTILPDYSAVDPNIILRDPPVHNTSQLTSVIDSTNEFSPPHSSSPPRYSLNKSTLLEWRPDPPVTQSSALPGDIVAQSEPYEFHYWYPIKSNDPWATLHLYTRDAVAGNPRPSKAQPKVPQVWSCDPVAGMVELDCTSLQTIQQIKVSLKGKFLTSSVKAGAFQFMNHEFTIWQRSYGDPRHFNTNEGLSNGKFDGKFIGKYSFPFSFPFPSSVDVQKKSAILPDTNPVSPFPAHAVFPSPPSPSPRSLRPMDHETRKPRKLSWISGASSAVPSSPRGNGIFSNEKRPLPSVQRRNDRSNVGSVASRIPQSFLEKGVTATVIYELSVIITHGRFKVDSRFKTNVSYIPALYPMPASQMRRDAYASSAHVPGPIKDPTGWFALPKATSFGMFPDDLGQREVAVDCTLYLAEPLSYARGAVIPCFLRLSSIDGEALRSLSIPNVPVVKLLRRLRYFEPNRDDAYAEDRQSLAFDTNFSDSLSLWSATVPTVTTVGKTSDFKVVGHELGAARWRVPPDDDVPQESHIRHLEGEIHLSVDLQPSCTCQVFYIEYFIEMMALQADYFIPKFPSNWPGKTRGGQHVISSVPVEITNLHRTDEPLPMAISECPALKMRRIPFEDAIVEEAEIEI